MTERGGATMPRIKRTAWEKIVRAGNRGTGLRLTAEEVGHLAADEAIQKVAQNETEDREAD